MDGSGSRLHGPDWKTIREHEISFGLRGIKENSYVATNGTVQESAQGEGLDIWAPALTTLDITAALTPGTTLLSIYNNDNIVVPGSNVYGTVPLNRPMIVDEIGVRLTPLFGSIFKDYRLSVNALWLNQATAWDKGTCDGYWMNNLNVGEGYGGGTFDTARLTFVLYTRKASTSGYPQPGDIVVGTTSGARMTITTVHTNEDFTGIMSGATDFALGEDAIVFRETIMIGNLTNCTAFTRYANTYPATNRLMWSPDRLYNAAVGPTEQPGIIPVGHGPNALVAYADADAEAVGIDCVRPLVPIISDSGESPGTFRPPKDSFIIDPGQSIAIQVQGLFVPPVAFSALGAPISATGTYSISAWIRFRQPLISEPYDWNREEVTDKWL